MKTNLLDDLAAVVQLQKDFDACQDNELIGMIGLREDTMASEFLRTHAAEIEWNARDAEGEREESWEVWQDNMPVASSDDLDDAKHYMAMYAQDGPVELVQVVTYRHKIASPCAREVGSEAED